MPLTIVAKIKAKTGFEEVIMSELKKLIAPTQLENGCINYDLHRSNDDKTLFLFYENWTDKQSWEQHLKAKHLSDYRINTQGIVESFELFEMNKVV
jgi:quinol monooxygenase YgiN